MCRSTWKPSFGAASHCQSFAPLARGGLALAVAALAPDRVAAALVDLPVLCHFRQAARIGREGPYLDTG